MTTNKGYRSTETQTQLDIPITRTWTCNKQFYEGISFNVLVWEPAEVNLHYLAHTAYFVCCSQTPQKLVPPVGWNSQSNPEFLTARLALFINPSSGNDSLFAQNVCTRLLTRTSQGSSYSLQKSNSLDIKQTKQTQQREEKGDYGLVWSQDGASAQSSMRILLAERKCGETITKGKKNEQKEGTEEA